MHQYATLVNDAEEKAIMMSKRGRKVFDLDYNFVFSIPVYNNVPSYSEEGEVAFPDPNK